MENGLKNRFRAIKFRAVDIFPTNIVKKQFQNLIFLVQRNVGKTKKLQVIQISPEKTNYKSSFSGGCGS